MGLSDILATLKKAKEYIVSNAPAALESIANISDQIGKAARDAETWFSSQTPEMMKADMSNAEAKAGLHDFMKEITELANTAPVTLAKEMKKKTDVKCLEANTQIRFAKVLEIVTSEICERLDGDDEVSPG